MNRRSLMGGASAAALAVVPAAVAAAMPGNPDADLIAMGARADALKVQWEHWVPRWWALDRNAPDFEHKLKQFDAMDGFCDAMNEMSDQALDTPATTLEGLAGKARVIRLVLWREGDEHDGQAPQSLSFEGQLAWSLLDDVIRLAGPPARRSTAPSGGAA